MAKTVNWKKYCKLRKRFKDQEAKISALENQSEAKSLPLSIRVQVELRMHQLRMCGFVRPILLSRSDYEAFRADPRVSSAYQIIHMDDPANLYAQEVCSWMLWDGFPIVNEERVARLDGPLTIDQARLETEGK